MADILCDGADVEELRLMRAFNQIDDPKTRRLVITIVEAIARGATGNVEKPERKDLPKVDA